MGVFASIKNWFKKNFGGGSGSKAKKARSVSNYGGGGSRTYRDNYSAGSARYQSREDEEKKRREQQQAKQKATVNALASISKRTDALASGKSSSPAASATSVGNGTARVLKKIEQKATPPDPKEQRRQDARKEREKRTEEFNKITKNKYNVDKNGLKARQAQKTQAYDAKEEMYEMQRHPNLTSFNRGVLSGVTFGGSELLAQKSKNRQETGAEQYYQQNKNKYAEFGGEVLGSLVGFGGTGEASARIVGKVAPKALKSGGTRLATKVARRAAEKEAVKRFGEGATKEVIEQIAKRRGAMLANEIGRDAATNLTTGLASDLSHSYLDSENSDEFKRNMRNNALLNVGLGSITSAVPALRVGRKFDDAIGNAVRNATELQNARQAMRDAFIREGDEAKRINFNELLAQNSPFRQADEVVENAGRAVEPPRTVQEEAAQAVKENMDSTRPKIVPPSQIPDSQKAIWASQLEEVIGQQEEALRLLDEGSPEWKQLNEQLETNRRGLERLRGEAEKVEPPRQAEAPKAQAETDFPYEGTPEAEEMNRRIQSERNKSAEEYANEREALEGRVKEIENTPPRFDEDEPLRVNKVSEDTPIGGTTAGERMAYSAYERNTGETVEGGIKSSWHDAWKASQEYHESHATGRDSRLSKTSVSQLNSMTSDTEREIREKLIDEGWLNYNVIRTDEMLDKVSKQFRDDPKRWVDDMIDVNNGKKLDFRETPEWQAMAHYIMAVVDPSADPASEIAYTEAYKLATQMSSKAGQTNNLRRQFVHLTPAGRRDAIVDEMAQILYNSQGFRDMHRDMPTDKFDALAYIKKVLEDDPEIEKRVKRLVEVGGLARDAEYGVESATKSADDAVENFAKVDDELPTGNAKQTAKKGKNKVSDDIMDAHADLMLELNKKNPKTKYDVLQEIRYLNMLGNPKTHIRNIFGSGFFAPIRQISNGIRAGIENSSYIKNSGLEVTKHGGLSLTAVRDSWGSNPTSEAGKKALEAYERVKPELLGAMKLDAQLYKGRAKTKAGKVLDAVSDFNSNWLSKEDDFFKQKAFRENYIKSYEAYVKSGTPITKKIEKKIEAEAMQEANIATFNEYNEFANWLARITKKAGDPNASTFGKGAGIALNAVMPFTKVPANIMKQSVNYSPFGLLKGFGDVRNAIKKGNSELLNKAIDELASGVTGTVIFGMGMLLGKTTNAFTTNAGTNDAAAKFKKQQGVQNYSVTFTNPADGEKYSMTLDWLVPNSATFFAGVELANQLKSGDFDILDFGGDWAQVASRVIEPVMETSMLSGLYSMLESSRNSYGDDDKQNAAAIMIRETVQSYLNSLAPTALGQLSRTTYKNDKQIAGDDDWEYFRNQLKSKVGLAETDIFGEELGADTTAYGDVKGQKEDAGDYLKSALKNFISPANIQKVDLDEVDEAKIKEYEDAVKNGADPTEMAYLFPKKQYKKQFTTGDLDVKLSNTDLSAYNQAKTTGGAEGMRYVLENIMFNRYVQDAKGNKTSTEDAYTPEMKQEMIKQFEGKSLREVEKWLREQPEFKNATEAERKRAIDGLWSYSKQGKAQGAKRVGEQAVIEKQGGDVNEYNFNNEISEKKRAVLAPLIAAGVVTYEQAVDFARYAGKTYYYENDEGGTSQTYYNKGAMMDYLKKKGYDDETAAALFNAFKAWNAKEYGSSSGYRRYGRGGYRRWHRGGGGSGKAKVPAPKTIKASDFVKGEALVSKRKSSSKATVTPKLERVKAKIDIPEAKW